MDSQGERDERREEQEDTPGRPTLSARYSREEKGFAFFPCTSLLDYPFCLDVGYDYITLLLGCVASGVVRIAALAAAVDVERKIELSLLIKSAKRLHASVLSTGPVTGACGALRPAITPRAKRPSS